MLRFVALAAIGVLAVLTACTVGPEASARIDAAEAVRRVLAQNPRFAEIGPRNPDLIGQAAWYEVAEGADGWMVQVRIGWGDCPAGCINEHVWTYRVSSAGSVELVAEEGDEPTGEGGVSGIIMAGPTCPVLTDPPDPACDDRPVAGATVLVVDAADRVVARIVSGDDGSFSAALAPGVYRLVPQPAAGLLGTAEELEVRVEAGSVRDLVIAYDTGIR